MNNTGIFEYSCEFWDQDAFTKQTTHGVVYADSFADATDKLEHYYDMIENLHLQAVDDYDSGIYEFEEGTVGFTLTVDEKGEAIKNG